jgi:uncharacterized protein with PQ loop repeat
MKRVVDAFAYFFGIITPLFSIPQLYEIWHYKTAESVSLASWGAFTIASVFWVFYGLVHKEKPIIISQILWFVLQLFIVIGILMYR